MTDQDLRVRQLAYRIWESEGRPEGQEQRHWETATKIVQAEQGQNTPVDDLPLREPGNGADPAAQGLDERGASDYAKPEPITSPAKAPVTPGTKGKATIAQAEKKTNTRASKASPGAAKASPRGKTAGGAKTTSSPRKTK